MDSHRAREDERPARRGPALGLNAASDYDPERDCRVCGDPACAVCPECESLFCRGHLGIEIMPPVIATVGAVSVLAPRRLLCWRCGGDW